MASKVAGNLIALTIVVSPTQPYNILPAVIPAKAGIQIEKTGFRIRSGMTEMRKIIIETVHYLVLVSASSRWLGAMML